MVEEESVEVGFPTPPRAVDEEEIWWYWPVWVCSPESSDVVGCVETGCEGVRDGVVSDSLEVVEAGFLLCDVRVALCSPLLGWYSLLLPHCLVSPFTMASHVVKVYVMGACRRLCGQ